ncbi:MAG: hypothetical protein H7062_02910 [Candidatus Saccharimonas sp.]|nr:hypothetical protein [Planctomycetaceae bacterium]
MATRSLRRRVVNSQQLETNYAGVVGVVIRIASWIEGGGRLIAVGIRPVSLRAANRSTQFACHASGSDFGLSTFPVRRAVASTGK